MKLTWFFNRQKEKIAALIPAPPSDEAILAAVDPWMLGVAVGAYQNKLSASGNLNFDMWWLCCTTTWIPKATKAAGISESSLKDTVLRFAKANAHRDYHEVINEQVRKRGQEPS